MSIWAVLVRARSILAVLETHRIGLWFHTLHYHVHFKPIDSILLPVDSYDFGLCILSVFLINRAFLVLYQL